MKNTYVKPEMQVEEFLANQYVAACGDTEYGEYVFVCDASRGNLYYFRSNKANGTKPTTGSYGTELGSYHPCSKKHNASTKGDFYYGYVDYNKNYKLDSDELVIVWVERNRYGQINDAHATTNVDQSSWEVVKS